MRKIIVVLALVAIAAIPVFGQWHADFRVTNNTGSSYTPYYSGGWGIAADDADVCIAWYDYTQSPYYARYHTFPIGSPAQTPNGEQVSTTYAYYPVIAIHNGERFVSWYYYSYPYYLFTRERNGSWGPIISHGYSYSSCYYPATATDDAGNLHCAFNRYYSGYRVYYQRKNSGSNSFTSPVLVYNPGSYRYAYRPSICITSDGVIHVSVGTNNGYRLVHAWSTNNGASWNTEYVTGTYTCYYSYATSICHDSEDNLYIAYTSYYSPRHIYVVSGTSGSWGTPEQVSHSTYSYVYYPSICCDTANNVWVCWDDRRGSNYEIYYNKLSATSGSWEGDQALTADDGQYSRGGQFAADEQGNVHICWYDRRDGNYEIYYNWYSVTGPGPGGRDLVCVRVTQPVGDIPKEPITPKAVIMNNGGSVDSGYAICEISGPGSTYEKGNIEGIVYLEPEEQDEVEFPSWTPPGSGGDQYRVEVTVYLWPEKTTEDDDPLNNTKVEYCTIEGGAQVDPIEIAVPQHGGVYHTMNPVANFMNVGEDPATNFYCYCEVYSMGYMTEPYIDSFYVANLDPDATVDVTFTKDWVCDDSLGYEAKFYAATPGVPERGLLGIEEFVQFQGIPGIAETADALRIEVSGPNPFIKGTLVSYAVSSPTQATVRIYDISGKVVRTLHEGELAGESTLYWDGTDDAGRALPGGLYFIRIATSEFTRTTKVVLVH